MILKSFVYLCISITGVLSQITPSIISNPEVYMNVSEIISFHRYPVENHEVVTGDNYILSLQRIPYGKKGVGALNGKVVFLQHGLLDSSFTWVNNRPSGSLAFILADLGYDVWLGNSRGNVYSRKHKSLSLKSTVYWDFTWDEMAKYDLPASIDYVLQVTKAKKLSYVGHSQGTEIAFAKLSENGPLNGKISLFVALAPVAYLGHLKTDVKPLFNLADLVNFGAQLFTHGEFLPNTKLMTNLMKGFCSNARNKIACTNIFFRLTGIDTKNLDTSRLPVYLAHIPAGTSSKNMVHYAQSFRSQKFQMYDYGWIGNLVHYRSFHPPQYGLSIKDVPVAIFHGGKDLSATPEDVTIDINYLGSAVVFKQLIPNYSHIDFVWAKDAPNVVYKDLIALIRKYG